MTTFPRTFPVSRLRIASGTSLRGNVLSMTGVIFLASMSSFNTTIDLRGPSCLGRDAGSSRRVTPRSVWRSDPGFRTNDDPNCRTGRIQHVCPIGCERTLAFGPPAVPRQIQDEVVALGTAREVLLRVVDDAVRADRAQHVELPGSITPVTSAPNALAS